MTKLKITTDDIRRELDRRKYNKIDSWFPDTGPLARDLYKKHMEFIESTKTYGESALISANRIGKSECAAYMVACFLTGEYPEWWNGRVFPKPVNWLVAGETGKLVRDSIQLKLLGPKHDMGSGMIRKSHIIGTTPKAGTPNAIDVAYIKHKSGGQSILQFQSYDQGREAFQATERDGIELDEEPPLEIYAECLIRTMTTNGIVLSTFTPLKGVTPLVISMQDKAEKGECAVVIATWDDAPHLSEDDKERLLKALPPHQRDARSKGVPSLGAGAIFPVLEEDIKIEAFPVPEHFKRLYGLDVGWNNTAAVWGAYDPDSDIIYVVDCYKRGQCEPAIHASAIKQRGEWVSGVIDPASRGRAQADGEKLVNLYRTQGLNLGFADNAVHAGLHDMYERMTTGRFKVFSTCTQWFEEYRLYRRDEKGKIVKQNDHLMDGSRYMTRSIVNIGTTKPTKGLVTRRYYEVQSEGGWMA